jgi:hypothetical protein
MLVDCLATRNWRMTFLNEKWLNTNKEVAHGKLLSCSNKDHIINLGRYLDKH